MRADARGWDVAPARPGIDGSQVHVWRAHLEAATRQLPEFESLLGADELERAARFRFPLHRTRFVARRATLRRVLGGYLGIAPAAVRFEYGAHGKPALARDHETELRFNASSSEELALFAVARGRDLGVDLEHRKPAIAQGPVPEHLFAASEVSALRALPPERQAAAFFECWVRKEAYVKARGIGLSLALDSFAVSLADEGPPRLLSTSPDPAEAARWTVVSLDVAPDYAAAVVVAGGEFVLSRWDCPPRLP